MNKRALARFSALVMAMFTSQNASAVLMQLDLTADFVWNSNINFSNTHTNKFATDAFGRVGQTESISFSVLYDDVLTSRTMTMGTPSGPQAVTLYAYNDLRTIDITFGNLHFGSATDVLDPLGSIDLGEATTLVFNALGEPHFNFFVGTPKQGSRTLLGQPEGHRVDAATYYFNTLDKGYATAPLMSFIPYLGDSLDTLAGRPAGETYAYLGLTGRLANLRGSVAPYNPPSGGGTDLGGGSGGGSSGTDPDTGGTGGGTGGNTGGATGGNNNTVPEPSALALLGLGLGLMRWSTRRKV